MELDYPRKKQQDAQTKTSLETYKKSYGITGFPTLVFADAQGRPIHTVVGYANPAQVMQDTKKAAEALNTAAVPDKQAGGKSSLTSSGGHAGSIAENGSPIQHPHFL